MTRIQVIGDDVWADGYRVATLVTDGVPATVSEPLRAALDGREVSRAYTTAKDRQYRRWSEA